MHTRIGSRVPFFRLFFFLNLFFSGPHSFVKRLRRAEQKSLFCTRSAAFFLLRSDQLYPPPLSPALQPHDQVNWFRCWFFFTHGQHVSVSALPIKTSVPQAKVHRSIIWFLPIFFSKLDDETSPGVAFHGVCLDLALQRNSCKAEKESKISLDVSWKGRWKARATCECFTYCAHKFTCWPLTQSGNWVMAGTLAVECKSKPLPFLSAGVWERRHSV